MILVTLGTQDKSFKRLLDAIQNEIDNGNITDRVVVQKGYTNFASDNMELFDLIPMEKFDELIDSCDILITHGGVGSIITGLKHNKKVIAAARLAKYGEHTNDHQLQIIDNFSKEGYILALDDFSKLGELLEKCKTFQPKEYNSNTSKMIKIVSKYIDKTEYRFNYKALFILIALLILIII